jgi:antitoxin component YwqK of YwqJK toxin-antitoxin module
MKLILSSIILSLLISYVAQAQVRPTYIPHMSRRSVRFNFVTKDSVNLALNDEFDMIEDSCSVITRYAHLDIHKRKFLGKFKDVSRANPDLVLTEGSYNMDGLKDGGFVVHFLSGKLEAKGNFKNGLYDGSWSIFYDNDKPRLTFDAEGNDIKIIDAWDTDGNKTVINGKGTYRVDEGALYWKGKLLNGKPDGTWKAMKTDDATNTSLVTENFKNGSFQKGRGPIGDYLDASRMVLVSTEMLPFTKAEKLSISSVPCNGIKTQHVVSAQYNNGTASFTEEIKRLITPYISKINIESFESEITVEGYVTDEGLIRGLNSYGSFRQDIARGLISQLSRLPPLVPASVDGKPIKQKITFKFVFTKGMYSFNYRFLPVELAK